jgi:MYXO-CTERM domain-containing protein
MAGAFSLTASFEYVQPLESVARATDHDLGAFDYGTNTAGAGMDASAGTGLDSGGEGGSPVDEAGGGSDGASPGSMVADDDGGPSGSDSGPGIEAGDAAHASSGCGCKVTGGAPGATGSGAGILGLAGILAWTRRRRG